MKTFVVVAAVAVVFVLFFPYLALYLYERLYGSTKISPSDFLEYLPNMSIGIFSGVLSFSVWRMSEQNKQNSIETSKGVIYEFITHSCSGFRVNHLGKAYHYYRLKYSNFRKHLQRLKSENILKQSDVELCKKIYYYVE